MILLLVVTVLAFFTSLRYLLSQKEKIILRVSSLVFVASAAFLFYALGILYNWCRAWGNGKTVDAWLFAFFGVILSLFVNMIIILNKKKSRASESNETSSS